MNQRSTEELFADILQKEMEASEDMEELVQNHSVEDVNEAASVVVDNLLQNIEDPERKQKLFMLLVKIGQTMGSKSMVESGKEHLEEMVDDSQIQKGQE